MNILLLTGSINAQLASPVYTSLMDTQERLKQYTTTIERYIKESDFDTFIFCENTGYEFDTNPLRELADKHRKSIEFLSFTGNIEAIKKQGKGYGEGECIEYAVNNSRYLKDNKICFYKVTGRLFINNINKIIRKSKSRKNCFMTRGFSSNFVESVFFKAQVSFFRANLLSVYTSSNDLESKFLEHVYFDILKYKRISKISPYPFINGNSGTTGKSYMSTEEYKKMKLLNHFGYFSINPTLYMAKELLRKTLLRLKILK